ncbi:MAG: DUF2628 domain-containing protein [Alphaproteobacteria bacterium]|nr:DUF2628 domain-containing protein [Pseudomonadota bacterium]
MRVYTVHLPPWTKGGAKDAVFLGEGFSLPAAIFGPFWALYHGHWRTTLLLLAGLVLLGLIAEQLRFDVPSGVVLLLGYLVFVGFNGNDWRRSGLERQDYRLDRVVVAKNREEAELRYFAAAAAV